MNNMHNSSCKRCTLLVQEDVYRRLKSKGRLIPTVIDGFISRECRAGLHQNCNGKWEGLGIQVTCICNCNHDNKKKEALGVASVPSTNTPKSYSHISGVSNL